MGHTSPAVYRFHYHASITTTAFAATACITVYTFHFRGYCGMVHYLPPRYSYHGFYRSTFYRRHHCLPTHYHICHSSDYHSSFRSTFTIRYLFSYVPRDLDSTRFWLYSTCSSSTTILVYRFCCHHLHTTWLTFPFTPTPHFAFLLQHSRVYYRFYLFYRRAFYTAVLVTVPGFGSTTYQLIPIHCVRLPPFTTVPTTTILPPFPVAVSGISVCHTVSTYHLPAFRAISPPPRCSTYHRLPLASWDWCLAHFSTATPSTYGSGTISGRGTAATILLHSTHAIFTDTWDMPTW